jgi:hypothetical protein
MKYPRIQEESLKIKVAQDFFGNFDCSDIIGKIDFTVKNATDRYYLWGEAKADVTDICAMLAQLILTIGKARTFDKIAPPPYIGCFDREKIAFVPYYSIQEIFYQSDFNWKITPSNTKTREFKLVYERVNAILTETPDQTYLFDFQKDEKELQHFIKTNFGRKGIHFLADPVKVPIDKNNFVTIYIKWLESVKPTIQVDWDKAKKSGIIDGDFYLADLLSIENKTLKEKLFVLLKSDFYELDRKINDLGLLNTSTASFLDNQKAYHQFWAKYERPPLEEYWDYITERRDLLVPQDVRERKGSFFTPRIWVELSQKYIADVLGKDWQDEYYVWDCAAGTGNLLAGLTNKYHIWASTLDKADVDVMHDRIDNGANLLKDHVFQFDFLNDDLSTLPEGLRDIINDENKRKKLVLYINTPNAYDNNKSNIIKTSYKGSVAKNKIHDKYAHLLKKANHELFAQFLARIYCEVPGAVIANFSKLKNLQSPNFRDFRVFFRAKPKKMFAVPAYTFDNVKGKFPIGFTVWNTGNMVKFKHSVSDIYSENGRFIGKKKFYTYDHCQYINEWLKALRSTQSSEKQIGTLNYRGNDFQHESYVFIDHFGAENSTHFFINQNNLILASIYLAVRKVIKHTWLNDRDQFLYPNDGWKTDREFRSDCLAYTLFHGSNNIQSQHGINHWIPFSEAEVNARSKFKSNFMTDFIAGKIERTNGNLFSNGKKQQKIVFSPEAKAVFAAGKKLWTYYHSQKKANVNASLYDIREHFQRRNASGKMNSKSDDEMYNALIANLRSALKTLAEKIEPKVYLYGFLKK